MPEAAEVEIVRRGLAALLIDQGSTEISRIEIFDPRLQLKKDSSIVNLDSFNKKVISLRRTGKFFSIDFDDKTSLEFHLRLAGRLLSGRDEKARAVFHWHDLGNPGRLGVISFSDTRRFATMKLISSKDFARNLGVDLLNGNLDGCEFPDSKRAVKAVFLDQKIISGIGNYLIDEALWAEKVLPTKPFDKLRQEQRYDIAYKARSVAQKALKRGGVSIKDYVDLESVEGNYQDFLLCYGRAGRECVRCGKKLSKTKVAGRGTTFCSFCQR